MKELIKKQRAFTLVELLVTVAITSILTTVVVVGYMNFLNKAAIATDEYLASQINRLIAGHRVFEKVEDENEIANVLKPNINPDVDIQTMKLDMNIYYNTDDKEFQVLKDVEAVGYENLHYYLSLNENNTNDFIDSNNTLIHLNNNFEFTSDISYLKQSTPQYLKAYKNNDSNQIIIEIWISGDSDKNSKMPSINLLETISLTDTFGNEIDKSSGVNFYCVDTDLVEYRNHPIYIEPYEINESSFIAYYPGTYTIKCTYKNYEMIFQINAINIYLSDCEPKLIVNDINYSNTYTINSDGTYNIEISISLILNSNKFINCFTVYDYNYDLDTPTNMKLTEDNDFCKDLTIIIQINQGTQKIQLEKHINQYSVSFSSIDLQNVIEYSVTYRYQARNGLYYYHTDTIPLSIQ